MSAPPFMQVYVADYTADVQHLTCEQDGAYWRLLRAMWRAGGQLENDAAKLARICGLTISRWYKISPAVMDLFRLEDGALTQSRLRKERENYEQKSQKNSQNGKRGGEAKALKNNNVAIANATNSPQRNPSILEPEPDIRELGFSNGRGSPSALTLAKPKAEAKGTRLPENWFPSVSDIEWADGHTPESLRREADKFRDYWRAVPGAKGRKLDWDATWRNWVRRSTEGQQQRNSNVQRPDAKRSAREENYARAFSGAQAASRQRSF